MTVFWWLRERILHSSQRLAWAVLRLLYLRRQSAMEEEPAGQEKEFEDATCRERSISEELGSRGGTLGVVTRAEAGAMVAAYGFRFVAMPLEYFYDAIRDSVAIPLEQFSKQLQANDAYCKQVVEDFFETARRSEEGSKGIEYLREEVFHHNHLRDTSLWVLSHGFALLSRFGFAYICFHRAKADEWQKLIGVADFREVSRFTFNVYLSGIFLKRLSIPVVEGYAHYRELMEDPEQGTELLKSYKQPTLTASNQFVQLHGMFEEAYGPAQAAMLIDQIARDVINLPIVQRELLSEFSYFNVQRKLRESALHFSPLARLREIARVLANEDLPSDPTQCHRRVLALLETADFEDQFGLGLFWYLTRTVIPSPLIYFLLARLLVSKYGARILSRVIWNIVGRGGEEVETYAYSDLPGIRMYTPDGGVINYDPALAFFHNEQSEVSFRPGQETKIPGFEFGIRGFTEQIYQLIQLQALLMNTLAAQFLYSSEDYRRYREFMFRWIPTLSRHREAIEHWLLSLDEKCKDLVMPLREKAAQDRDPLGGAAFGDFLAGFEELFWRCWDSLSEDAAGIQEPILTLGDGLYMHGLS